MGIGPQGEGGERRNRRRNLPMDCEGKGLKTIARDRWAVQAFPKAW